MPHGGPRTPFLANSVGRPLPPDRGDGVAAGGPIRRGVGERRNYGTQLPQWGRMILTSQRMATRTAMM